METTMLVHPTLTQLTELGLTGMAKAFKELRDQPETQTLEHADWLGLLLDREAAERKDRRLKTRLRAARLRFVQACVEDVDFTAARGLDRRLVQELATGRWLKSHQNLIITGACGTGKTWLACALGHNAARAEATVLYQRLPRLFADLALARGDGRYPRLFRSLCWAHLLILDDWGPEPMLAEQRRDLLEIVEDRYGRASTLLTSQLPLSRWHDVVGEPTLADAILDRLVHHAHRIELQGESLRKRRPAPS
jgi:DNA replication protein DnaC